MGAKTFQSRYAKKDPIEFCEDVVRVYREDWAPKVPALWRDLQRAAHDAIWTGRPCEAAGVEYRREGSWLTARLPSGRKLYYHGAAPAMVTPPWEGAEPRRGWTYRAKKLGQWRVIAGFGGHLAENLSQALSRDLTVAACLRAEEEGFPVIFQVYDEIVCEVPEARADHKVLSEIMLNIPDWARTMRIPVASEGFTAERYRK
jgi:DNA polymerase